MMMSRTDWLPQYCLVMHSIDKIFTANNNLSAWDPHRNAASVTAISLSTTYCSHIITASYWPTQPSVPIFPGWENRHIFPLLRSLLLRNICMKVFTVTVNQKHRTYSRVIILVYLNGGTWHIHWSWFTGEKVPVMNCHNALYHRVSNTFTYKCPDVPLRNYSLTWQILLRNKSVVTASIRQCINKVNTLFT